MSQFDLRPPSEAQRALITTGLDPDERRVLLELGTEAPQARRARRPGGSRLIPRSEFRHRKAWIVSFGVLSRM